jgi:type II secretory pathway pseudopilin PulG
MTSLMRDNRGFSLVELLVSTLIMMLVLGLSARALTESMRADEAIGLMADNNQSLQSAQSMMVRDLVDAGRNVRLGGLPLPIGPDEDVVRPGPANAAAAGWPTAGILYSVTPGNELGPAINENPTDVVTIVSVDDRVDIANSFIAVDGEGATVTMVAGPSGSLNTEPMNTIRVGDLMWVTRNGVSAVLYVTGVGDEDNPLEFTATTADDPSKFNQQGAASGSMAQIGSTDLTVVPPAVAPLPDTSVRRIKMTTYWVAEQGGMPYLWRQENYRDAVQVGLGVDNLEIAYDVIDAGAVVRVNNPFTDRPGTSPNQFDKAHLVLAVRSDKRFAQTRDFLRNDLTTQVSLRSLQVQQNFM